MELNQLTEFHVRNNIIVKSQFGFRINHSCETPAWNICDKWIKKIDQNKMVLAVLLDFQRAFETIDRPLLLCKLSRMGIQDSAHNLLSSYLSNTQQNVKIEGYLSSSVPTKYGIP